MKIYLIELRDHRSGMASQYFNSLMLPILAVWSQRVGWQAEVAFTDYRKVDYSIECDVVALSLYTHLAPEGYELARKFRDMGKIVIIGGPHSKGCSSELIHYADLVFDRCNETVWAETLQAIEKQEVVANSRLGTFVPAEEMTNIPSYSEFKPYYGKAKVPLLLSSLGCPHDCDFCTDWNSKYIKREVDDVIRDLQDMKSRFFIFCDPNFGANHKFTSDLLRKMIPLKKKYMMETSLAWLEKEKYLKLLKESGCIGVEIGVESLTTVYKKNAIKQGESPLEAMIKKIEKIKLYIPAIQVNVVLGLDDDTEETFRLVDELYRRANIDVISLFVVTPFPGTPFYERMNAAGRIFETEWKYFNCYDLTVTINNFTEAEFCQQMIKLYKKTHSPLVLLKKVVKHFVQYRNIKMTGLLAVVLITKCFNTWFYSIPDLHKTRQRTEIKLQELEQHA